MKIALTAWEDRISPVFDAARTLLIAEIENEAILSRKYMAFNPDLSSGLVDILARLGIDVFICGAISAIPANHIEAGGIELIAFIGGNIEEVLDSVRTGAPIAAAFAMPGCGRS